MTEQEFRNLLDKYVQGTATEEELKLLVEYEEFAVKDSKDKAFESDMHKEALNREIKKIVLKKIGSSKSKSPWLKIAASIAVVLTATIWAVYHNGEPNIYRNETAHFMPIDLPDGSRVMLNGNSKLQYHQKSDGVRSVVLEGEAFFDVARDEQAPFVIQTNDVRTKVLGTSFNIRSTDSIIDISVATGLVQVTSLEESVQLRPNQKVSYYTQTHKMQKDSIDHNLYTSWYKNSIKLDGVRMLDVARILESRYGLRVYFKEEMTKEQKMTIAIDQDESIEDVMDNINFISQLSLTKNQNNEITVQLKK
ncbi:FecR domain-containing protein [Muricauda oceani]|uniref:FecR family protein n=1 Tax=Flagellimonas oceani TaxID=2698672 RepID=A0A6G7J0T3_9FLAO|nr:FecR family protein [Allomuricauda oceani]MBW8244243.1 FecR domain-containing protein [Allomuricauda oceani]QII44107.1 FecR family protein [Allomuricauda oceani]